MTHLEDQLSATQFGALAALKGQLHAAFQIEGITLYGSVARGEAGNESDIDLLILTTRRLSRPERHQITAIIFEINLRYDTNFSSLVIDRAAWESGLASVLPIRAEILRDGIAV